MNYNPKSKSLQLSTSDIDKAASSLLYAMKCIREMACLPLKTYKRKGPLELPDHAQKSILDAANYLGIDLGGQWGEQIDVSEDA